MTIGGWPGALSLDFETWDTISLTRNRMSDVKITVGGAMEDEASRNFIDAWHRAERSETFPI